MTVKNVLRFLALIGWPFVLLICVYVLYNGSSKDREAKKRQELLSDTASVNRAHRTYERIHHQILMEDSDYVRLYRENQELKNELKRIKEEGQASTACPY